MNDGDGLTDRPHLLYPNIFESTTRTESREYNGREFISCSNRRVGSSSGFHDLQGVEEEGIGPDEGIRTPNPQFRRLMLYPLSYVRSDPAVYPSAISFWPERSVLNLRLCF